VRKNTIEVQLLHPFELPDGSIAEDAVLGLMTLNDRLEMRKKFPSADRDAEKRSVWLMQKRLQRLGSLTAPIDAEVIQSMPTSDFDQLLEAMWALDSGFDSIEAFRASDEYRQYVG